MNGQKRKELKSYKRTSFYPLSVVKLTEKHLIQNWLFYHLSGERTHPPLETLLKHGASPYIFSLQAKVAVLGTDEKLDLKDEDNGCQPQESKYVGTSYAVKNSSNVRR